MEAAYETFLNQPNRENYCRVRHLLFQDGDAVPRMEDLFQLIGELSARRHEMAARLCEQMSSCWLLSPRFHEMSAAVAAALDDAEWEQLERFQLDACLTGLLGTGDGWVGAPFLISYTSDVYDILAVSGRDAVAQHLVRQPSGCFDLVSCSDGTELWFARGDLDVVHDRLSPAMAETLLSNDLG